MCRVAVIIGVTAIAVNSALALPGSGTQADPWRIESLADFNEFAGDANYWDDYTRLETDVNLSGLTYTTAVIAPDTDNSNNEFDGIAFAGVFEGNGHTITGLTIDDGGTRNDYLGLFGFINSGKAVNVALEGGSVSGTGVYVGGIVGHNSGGNLWNCHSAGSVRGLIDVGGLAGWNSAGNVSNCYSTAYVRGEDDVGGLVGLNSSGSVSNCYSTGDVSSALGFAGGLVGSVYGGSVSNCYSAGDVRGEYDVGGLVGLNRSGSVSNCYASGDANGVDEVGGLVGWNSRGSVSNCFWDTETQSHGVTESIGDDGGTVDNIAGLPTAQMQAESTFTSAGWDFLRESANGTSETWQIPAGGGYPVLSFFHSEIPFALSGSGTAVDPYLIRDANHLGMVRWYPADRCFKLTNDIDLSGMNWSVAVVPAFSGCLDGAGHKLTEMKISGGGYLGLIGYLVRGGRVRNLGLEGGSVHGAGSVHGGGDCIGGVVGVNMSGSVSNCYSTVDVNGVETVGSLVGANYGRGVIAACYSGGDVNGLAGVGGLVGANGGSVSNCCSVGRVRGRYSVGGLGGSNYSGAVSNCYSIGDVSGEENVGGLVGTNGDLLNAGGAITNCYSTGDVSGEEYTGGLVGRNGWLGIVSDCFWDAEMQSHGVTDCIGYHEGGTVTNVAGVPTVQMQTRSTYTSAGWDFVGETANGTEDIWTIHETVDYPKFVWKLVNFTGWCEVDLADFAFFADRWMDTNCGDAGDCDGTDIDFSGTVDARDLGILCGYWLAGAE